MKMDLYISDSKYIYELLTEVFHLSPWTIHSKEFIYIQEGKSRNISKNSYTHVTTELEGTMGALRRI